VKAEFKALLVLALLCATSHAQVTQAWTVEHHQSAGIRSAAGTCSGFICDHVTVTLDDRSAILQFT
jgi:hypothetical protein